MKLGDILNAAGFQIQNVVAHNAAADLSNPKEGQYFYDTTIKRMKYWSSSTGAGAGWITLNPSTVQTITLQGHVVGTWSAGIINTTATRGIIEDQPTSFHPDPDSHILYYDATTSNLAKFGFDDLQDWVQEQIGGLPDFNADTYLGDKRLVLTNGSQTNAVRLSGTANQIAIDLDSGTPNRLIFSLPSSITVSSINVTNLTINGVPYAPYVHPTQSAITVSGSGLQFIQSASVNTLGHTTALSLGTIPSASTTVVGVMRFATNGEITSGTAGVAVQASQLTGLLGSWGFKQVISASGGVTHNLGTLDIAVECYDQLTGETIYPTVVRTNLNVATITLGSGAPANVVVLIRRII